MGKILNSSKKAFATSKMNYSSKSRHITVGQKDFGSVKAQKPGEDKLKLYKHGVYSGSISTRGTNGVYSIKNAAGSKIGSYDKHSGKVKIDGKEMGRVHHSSHDKLADALGVVATKSYLQKKLEESKKERTSGSSTKSSKPSWLEAQIGKRIMNDKFTKDNYNPAKGQSKLDKPNTEPRIGYPNL